MIREKHSDYDSKECANDRHVTRDSAAQVPDSNLIMFGMLSEKRRAGFRLYAGKLVSGFFD